MIFCNGTNEQEAEDKAQKKIYRNDQEAARNIDGHVGDREHGEAVVVVVLSVQEIDNRFNHTTIDKRLYTSLCTRETGEKRWRERG